MSEKNVVEAARSRTLLKINITASTNIIGSERLS